MNLASRKEQILTSIIEEYVRTAQPVGSSCVSRKGVKASPATIRHEMAELESLHFLEQPYTSAGRVPTEQGFRYYVDRIVDRLQPLQDDRDRLGSLYYEDADPEDLISRTAEILSELSRQIGVIMVIPTERKTLRGLRISKVPGKRLRVTFEFVSGSAQERLIEDEWDLDPSALTRLNNMVSRLAHGKTLLSLRRELIRQMEDTRAKADRIVAGAVQMSARLLEHERPELYVRGQANLFDLPEFAEVGRLKDMIKALEEKAIVVELLEKASLAAGARVIIGEESDVSSLQTCSIITSSYGRGEMPAGTLGVIGPIRMNYRRLIPLVRYTSELISENLSRME
ncbi:MAG: heat-inducible transcriptional repressor HrcA [bacterium]